MLTGMDNEGRSIGKILNSKEIDFLKFKFIFFLEIQHHNC